MGHDWGGGAPATPPTLEIADLIRTAGADFVERNRQWIRWKHVKVLRAIERWSYGCARRASRVGSAWGAVLVDGRRSTVREQQSDTLGNGDHGGCYMRSEHGVRSGCTHRGLHTPRYLVPLVLQNKRVIYDLLFPSSAETLLEVARDPRIGIVIQRTSNTGLAGKSPSVSVGLILIISV